MRIGRMARRDALYDVSVSARTFGKIEETVISPRDFTEIVDANLDKATGRIKHGRIQCFGEFKSECSQSENRVNSIKKIKRSASRKPIFK